MCMIFFAGHMIMQAFYLIVWVISVSWCLTIDWFWKNNVRHTNEEACLSWIFLQWTHESWWWIFATWWFFISENERKIRKICDSWGVLRQFSKLKKWR
jgi:hypothetical protein